MKVVHSKNMQKLLLDSQDQKPASLGLVLQESTSTEVVYDVNDFARSRDQKNVSLVC